MKKSLLVMLLAMLSFFMFLGISQAGQCIYLFSEEGVNCYYNPSEVSYSGDIVTFTVYYESDCTGEMIGLAWDEQINCAKRMYRDRWDDEWSQWKIISPGSRDDTLRIKLCR